MDHDLLVADLTRRLDGLAHVRVSDCLLVCGDSNVIVVSPSSAARSRGARPVWIGQVLSDAINAMVAGWVRAGGPGCAELPVPLLEQVTSPFVRPDGREVVIER